jgi:hypothetical protein
LKSGLLSTPTWNAVYIIACVSVLKNSRTLSVRPER